MNSGSSFSRGGYFWSSTGAAAVEEEQPQEESSLLPLNSTLMGVLESNTRRDETEMADQPAAKRKKSTAGSVIFQDGRRISDFVPQSLVRPPDSPRREKFKKAWPQSEVKTDQIG